MSVLFVHRSFAVVFVFVRSMNNLIRQRAKERALETEKAERAKQMAEVLMTGTKSGKPVEISFPIRSPLVPEDAIAKPAVRSQLARARLLINACIRFVKVCSGGKADRDEASPCSNLRMTQPEPRSRSQRPRGRRRERPRRTKQLRIKRHDRWAESGVVVGLENLEPWTHEGSRAESKMFNAAKSSPQSGRAD